MLNCKFDLSEQTNISANILGHLSLFDHNMNLFSGET